MNQRLYSFIRNVLYAVGANLSRIGTTLILTLLLARMIPVEDYSYWQLYLFYASYFIYSSIGWCEGTYLKYGGWDYDQLDGHRCAAQFRNMCLYEGVVTAGIVLVSCWIVGDGVRLFLLVCAAIYMWLYILRYQLQTLLQATNRISHYAQLYSGERLVYFVLVVLGLLAGKMNFYLIIFSELFSNIIMLGYGIYLCKEIIWQKPVSLRESMGETWELIGIGYKLTLAGLANQIIIGIVRYAIEWEWGTITFGKISLSFSMANMLITCITAISIVLFPMLKRSDPDKIVRYYPTMRAVQTIPMYGVLMVYAPVNLILSWWLPQYAESLKYLAILFPLCIYEVRNSVLSWTYLKVLRKESLIMKASLVMIGVSAAITILSVFILGSLDLAVTSIVVVYGMKAAYTEWLLGQCIGFFPTRDWLVEVALSAAFILCNWYMAPVWAFLSYLAMYAAYTFGKRKDIARIILEIKKLERERWE